MSASTAPCLAQLDALHPATLPPETWSANLAALVVEQPALAEEVKRTALPESWRAAVALDGFVTFRTEPPGEPAAWLGGTAAPLTRARSRLAKFDHAGKNPALPTCGAGAELDFLLTRLPAQVAVFVFEADIRVLAALLRAHDWSSAIADSRCVLVPPGREKAYLAELMESQPGLLPPGEILLPDLVSASRLAELREIGEHLHRRTSEQRTTAISQLRSQGVLLAPQSRASSPRAEPVIAPARVAVLVLKPHATSFRTAECLARAAADLSWPVLHRATTDPRHVHPLSHCRALADFRPTLTVSVGGPHVRLPLMPAGANCVWVLEELGGDTAPPSDGTLYLAASPLIAAGLRSHGVPEESVRNWYWACEEEAGADAVESKPPILVLGDLPDVRPETYGIQQPLHRKLWSRLTTIVAETWETPRILEPQKLLVLAERQSGVEVRDPVLRASLVRVSERALIPAVILEQIAQVLAASPLPVLTIGRGWERMRGARLRPCADSVFDIAAADCEVSPAACICAGQHDPLTPALLRAAARGWPLWIHARGDRAVVTALGDTLRPTQHFEPFGDRRDLRRCLEALRADPHAHRTMGTRARRHVAEHHTYKKRWLELLELLGPSNRGGCRR